MNTNYKSFTASFKKSKINWFWRAYGVYKNKIGMSHMPPFNGLSIIQTCRCNVNFEDNDIKNSIFMWNEHASATENRTRNN